MGDLVKPFREVGKSHYCSGNVGDFNFSACTNDHDELGSFNFDMGYLRNACGNVAEASTAAIYGVEAFFELSDAARAFCDAAGDGAIGEACDGAHAFLDDYPKLGWVSPRISFSQDLTVGECEASGSSRACPEKRKRQGAENGESSDGFSSEFEFLSNDATCGGFTHHTNDVMLSADELFANGKLLPMHTQETASSSSSNGELNMQRSKCLYIHTPQTAELSSDELCTHSSKLTIQKSHADEVDSDQKLMARQLSLDLPWPNSPIIMCELAPIVSVSVSVDNSPCCSPPRSSAPPTNAASTVASTSPTPHKACSKYSFRIKDFFKPKRVSSSINPQLTRDNSTASASTSTCRIPIGTPRSFWPFSRSNSAGESKTATPPPPILPPRSNSAGESNTSRVSADSKRASSEACILELNISHGQDGMVSASEDEAHISKTDTDVSVAKDSIDGEHCTESVKQASSSEEESVPSTTSQQGKRGSNKGKSSGSPGRATRKRYMYSTANFLRGSPGRRGGMNSLVKVNASRIVLRNLERCSADRKLCRETSGRRTVGYPVALRVSPVLNVAVYRGKVPSSSSMFGLRSLFSSKKEKPKGKDADVNNWRAGA